MKEEKIDKFVSNLKAVFEANDYLYFYKDVLTEERTNKEVEFLTKELELNSPMKILDLACGYGRHANRLAELGHNVTGVDINSDFLEIAKNEAKEKGLSVEYIMEDMRKISFYEEFDRVLLLFTSFGYFEDNENFLVLKNVANALKPNGLFCFDILNRDTFLKNFPPYIVEEKGNDLMIDRITFDSTTGRIYNRRIYIRDGKRKDAPFFVRLYNPTEIKELLKRVGLSIQKIYADFDSKPFTSESKRIVIIALKF
ncbi:MAG: class I SAM-dependent methyltransferase [candidate division WOR-3 bacterium]